MTALSLLSFFTTVAYLYLGIYAWLKNRHATLNRVFLLLCCCLAVWGLAYSFIFPAPDEQTVRFWYRVSSVGWCLFGGITLHFVMILTRREWWLSKWWVYVLLYGPGLLMIYQVVVADATQVEFSRHERWGWVEIFSVNFWVWFHTVSYVTCIVVAFCLVWTWGVKTKAKNETIQAKILIVTGMFGVGLGSVNAYALSLDSGLPAIEHVYALVWAVGMWFAISKYELMVLTEHIAAKEILKRVQDLIIIVNPGGEITRVNRRVVELLGYDEPGLVGRRFDELIVSESDNLQQAQGLLADQGPEIHCKLAYKCKNGRTIPVNAIGSTIKDRLGVQLGTVVVAQDIRQTVQLKQEIMDRKRAEASIRHLAYHDPLTDLPNRKFFLEHLSRELSGAKSKSQMLAVMFLDLDNFKYINDNYGHDTGDKVLCEVANRLKNSVRHTDIVCRMGGDEFIILCSGIIDEEDEEKLVRKVFCAFDEVMEIDGIFLDVKCSVGVSCSTGDISPDELIRQADNAMYSVKRGKHKNYLYA